MICPVCSAPLPTTNHEVVEVFGIGVVSCPMAPTGEIVDVVYVLEDD